MFTKEDQAQFTARQIPVSVVEQQLANFQNGFPYLQIRRAATIGDGLMRLGEEELENAIQAYEKALPHQKVVKFVPASGAASRMFKDLFAALNDPAKRDTKSVRTFFERLADFAFYKDLQKALAAFPSQGEEETLAALLTDKGLAYGSLPKGLLKFHAYGDYARTPLEEHMVEGASYSACGDGVVYLHLTVSPEHRAKFEQRVAKVLPSLKHKFGVQFDITFSEQKKSTDTLAVDMDNQPFRETEGSILFRPGGHGALLANLNEIEADIIFIKNIDNVVPDRLKGETIRYKRALAGVLIKIQQKIFAYLKQLDGPVEEADLEEISTFLREELCVEFDLSGKSREEQTTFLKNKLDRPLRVCGMVKNEGEPGGGPFWSVNADGTVSLQIAESAQIDPDSPEQQAIVQQATHFNPVDLVCATKDRHGQAYDLMQYRDPQTGFIAEKSKDGRQLKAQELPGLWNGAMADWNTLFVEVPIITFNPVKTVLDLLRQEHQG
jgi:hypothetical protein